MVIQVAAQNLPAKAVENEVLRNFTEVGQLSGVPNNEGIFAINRLRKAGISFGLVKFGWY